ncbi:hypothetical protein BGW37DRAFT_478069 [Umbelopsis sp. PMI_123]|nr:hypothetical protein BGW37DRAFT_478069 [Umbelopsis sp. PMI_123]
MPSSTSYKPSHPEQFHVEWIGDPENFNSRLRVVRSFKKGDVIVSLEGLTAGPKAYSSVQISETEHVELNSDLLYMNHSCSPTAILDLKRKAVLANKDLAAGDEITFFYPSTEWDMAQPFDCWCGSTSCIKRVQGASKIDAATLKNFQLSEHIQRLLDQRTEK